MAEKVEPKKRENATQRWWRETVGELRKVSWPSRHDAVRLTWIVLAVMVAMSVLLGVLDFGFSSLMTLLLA